MDNYGTEERIREYIRRCVSFTVCSPWIAYWRVYGRFGFGRTRASPNEKLYAVAETPKCAPDAVQVVTSATMGNSRLRIIETGKFSVTLNRGSTEERADGIRVYVDATKIRRYPTLDLWYTNDPRYKSVDEKDRVYDEILQAGRSILSWERVKVSVLKRRYGRPCNVQYVKRWCRTIWLKTACAFRARERVTTIDLVKRSVNQCYKQKSEYSKSRS